jgi:hypothetical protein
MRGRQPFGVRAVNAAGALAGRVGLSPSLDPASLVAAARRRTGLQDLGDDGAWRPGFELLAASLEDEAGLTTIGRIAARTRVLALLETRLRLLDHRARHRDVAEQAIERPIFVLGLPRTGTTVLYGMLAANPAMRAPLSWEVARPFPPPTGPDADRERIGATEKEFRQFFKLAPHVEAIHPLGALLPQECLALQAPSFVTYEFPTTFPVPSYWRWLRGADVRPGYEFERWFLQHLQAGYGGEHWILKTPAHLMWLDVLLEVFPDALLVHTHRDPTTVMASVCSLMHALRSAVSGGVDPHEVGREQLDAWAWGLERTLSVRGALPDDRVVDVRFEDTLGDPVGTVRSVYEHLGLPLTGEVERGVRAYLAANPRDKHGRHTYRLEDYGLTEADCDAAFAAYRDRFAP